MDFSAEEVEQIFKIFKDETQEHVDNINNAIVKFEKNPEDIGILSGLFREAHSIKGSARMLGIVSVQTLAHKLEDLLKLVKDGVIVLTPETIDILYETTDTILKLMEKITPQNLDYKDKNAIELAFKIDYLKDSMLLDEKKKNIVKPPEKNFPEEVKDEQSMLKFIKKHISLLDNKFHKDASVEALLKFIDEELSKGLPENEKHILKITRENLVFIKEKDILPSIEIAQIIEQALKSIGTNPDKEKFNQIILKQASIKQLMLFDQEKVEIFEKNKPLVPKTEAEGKSEITPEKYIDSAFKTLRVDTAKLDKLEQQTEELIVLKIKSRQHEKIIKETYDEILELQKRLNKALGFLKETEKRNYLQMNDTFSPTRALQKQLEKANEKMEKIYNTMNFFQKDFSDDDSKLRHISDEIESTVKSIRILPLATILHMFPRMVRDISRKQNKQVEIVISGSETGADKTIIEELKAPLVHIINNAIDHGIETPQERIKKGKNPTGKIILNSYHLDNRIYIEISDDGRGLDIKDIKKKALEDKIISQEELQQLSENQLSNLIFWPGFTTETKVTNTSGRGVGLDVVHTTISQLDGKVTISTKDNEGFKITLSIPIVIATLKALLIKVSNQVFAIPSGYVKHVRSIIDEDVFTKEGKPHILYEGSSVQLAKLSSILHYENADSIHPFGKHDIVIIQSDETTLALEVDEILRTEEIIQKKLNPPLSRVKNIAGISSLASGESCFILNISDIIKSSIASRDLIKNQTILALPTNFNKTHKVLIVDDSYTTLMLENNILKSAGYQTVTANNGVEALKKLTYENIDIIITDLEMPKMDGIEFVQKVREKDPKVPIIVLTSHEEKLPNIYIQNLTNEIILKKEFSKTLFLQKISENLFVKN